MPIENQLIFQGIVRCGVGQFAKKLVIPGSEEISLSIRDWPERLQPGTLNIRVEVFPMEYSEKFGQENLKFLDRGKFRPEATLKAEEIKNNTLPPTPEFPERGRAQIWRAILTKVESGNSETCWVLRRIDSGLCVDLELVSSKRLRDQLVLEDGDKVVVEMEGTWDGI
jgi:hypothetical protein